MRILGPNEDFPPVSEASEEGLLAVGGTLSVERLLSAYSQGIFPWYEEGQPVLWWAPDPRMVLFPGELKISKSLRRTLRKGEFHCTMNTAFDAVIAHCSAIPRKGQEGTWITSEMVQAYLQLHELGHAHSVECWLGEELVGGLYGIDLPGAQVFCGESMFSRKSDASKVAFCFLVDHLIQREYRLIDCQMYTDHLASLGAEEISREAFTSYLREV